MSKYVVCFKWRRASDCAKGVSFRSSRLGLRHGLWDSRGERCVGVDFCVSSGVAPLATSKTFRFGHRASDFVVEHGV